MKKKLLVGLLTIAACFSIGSTSFASSASTTSPISTPATTSVSANQEVTPLAGGYREEIIHMKSGYGRYLAGYNFQLIFNDGAIEFYEDGFVIAVKYGAAGIFADDGNGNTISYTILVDRQ
ncbi:hypothetical protein [Paenibacillus riograndensis]|uniref:Putative secreted protein n=1 Tax=Paenibacillus riograndensis SBR5 TaxID=1073571 RepID=A0A0E4H9M8_9BACL|nr:hypothetical protein [Paenibacillus riograndensis]CQR55256.1 putative secreted protein [Paenibacillus riograndensis SBR5]